MRLSPYEKETIVNFNEADKTASVYTHNKSFRRRLNQLLKTRPDEITVVRTGDDYTEYIVPKKWIKISPTRKMTEEQKKAAAERLAAYKYQTKPSDIDDEGNFTHNICEDDDKE